MFKTVILSVFVSILASVKRTNESGTISEFKRKFRLLQQFAFHSANNSALATRINLDEHV